MTPDVIAGDRQRILIVDDEAPIRSLFETILAYGLPSMKVDLACNGLEAVRIFQLYHHAVITMDLRMPEMDVAQAATAIYNHCLENNWEIPAFVFCTGFEPPDSLNEIIGDGHRHCLIRKPMTSNQIINTVKSRLAAIDQLPAAAASAS